MKKSITFLTYVLLLLSIKSFAQVSQDSIQENQNEHRDPTHNFTMQRLIIVNEKNQMLMCREDYVWATPAVLYSKREFLKESLDNLASTYGIKITTPELRGYFSYKYDYHPYSTLRSYYVARYVSGEIKIPDGMDEAKWVTIPEAIELNTVISIKQITKQIMNFPNTIWGGSFMVSRTEKGHPTKQVEAFYPLFSRKDN